MLIEMKRWLYIPESTRTVAFLDNDEAPYASGIPTMWRKNEPFESIERSCLRFLDYLMVKR